MIVACYIHDIILVGIQGAKEVKLQVSDMRNNASYALQTVYFIYVIKNGIISKISMYVYNTILIYSI